MKHPERVEDYLEHIVEAIERTAGYLQPLKNPHALQQNQQVQDAVVRNIEIIGEAASNILRMDADFASNHSELRFDVDWQVVCLMIVQPYSAVAVPGAYFQAVWILALSENRMSVYSSNSIFLSSTPVSIIRSRTKSKSALRGASGLYITRVIGLVNAHCNSAGFWL